MIYWTDTVSWLPKQTIKHRWNGYRYWLVTWHNIHIHAVKLNNDSTGYTGRYYKLREEKQLHCQRMGYIVVCFEIFFIHCAIHQRTTVQAVSTCFFFFSSIVFFSAFCQFLSNLLLHNIPLYMLDWVFIIHVLRINFISYKVFKWNHSCHF